MILKKIKRRTRTNAYSSVTSLPIFNLLWLNPVLHGEWPSMVRSTGQLPGSKTRKLIFFLFKLTPQFLQYKHNSPWWIIVLNFRDITNFSRLVAHCSLNDPQWLIIVSRCRMQTHPASGCRQLSLTFGYYKFPERMLADRRIYGLLRHPCPYICQLLITLDNTQNVSVTKIVDSSSLQRAETKYGLRIQFLALVVMIHEVWLNT